MPNVNSLSERNLVADTGIQSILVMRLHAVGDVAITLPALVALRAAFPLSRIDILTSLECVDLVRSLDGFDNIYAFDRRSRSRRILGAIERGLQSRLASYDVVCDLQANWVTRTVRYIARPRYYAEFDRFSSKSAASRTLDVFRAFGISEEQLSYALPVKEALRERARSLLRQKGWDGRSQLVLLNPAGTFPSRRWPTEYFARLAKLISDAEPVQFVVLGTWRIQERAHALGNMLGSGLINLVGLTTLGEALAVLQHVSLAVSEDSGLLHMATASGVPMIALFGSTNHVWASPPASHSEMFNSGDLECGPCMAAECRFGDVHCLTRVTPEMVVNRIRELRRRVIARKSA